jgi:cytoskeletal protein CcmA (bactofilin family)
MFSRTNNKETKIETVIGLGTSVEGNFHTSQGLRIDGKVKGSVQAETLIIGVQGAVSGDITGNKITISGRVEGNVNGSSSVELLAEGQVLGDISTNKLLIADGARFEGHCHMKKTDGQIIELNPDHLDRDSQKGLKFISQNKQKAPAAS